LWNAFGADENAFKMAVLTKIFKHEKKCPGFNYKTLNI
jgi:hypothetical protein